jgi:hypothetical protein
MWRTARNSAERCPNGFDQEVQERRCSRPEQQRHDWPAPATPYTFVGFAVFVAGVEHLSEKADKITKDIQGVQMSLDRP